MIMVISEHSVDMALIPPDAFILDIGCRNNEFALGVYAGRLAYRVDIDEEAKPQFCLAISDKDGYCGIERTSDPQATRMSPTGNIPMMTIPTFSKMVGVKKWDLIKMDIEGEEIKVLRSLPHPYCKQISVEFHAHRGQTKQELDTLLDWLNTWYDIHNRVWEDRYCAGCNYWDILLITK